MWVTQAAELVPERVEKLVYAAAFLPQDGQALTDLASGDVVHQQVLTIDTDHCPSPSRPRELADHLLSLAP
jgi:hypothetical protein